MRVAALVAVAAAVQAAPSSLEERQVVDTPCHDVHFFVARGSYEGYTLDANRQDKLLVPEVCNGRKNCGYEDIVYPAVIGDDYCGSETQGVNNGLGQLKAYARRCPNSKIVLTGYSQGGQVVGDMLGGSGGGTTCDAGNAPLNPSKSPGNKIAAITLFGDTRRTPGQGYNYGTAGVDAVGKFPRGGEQLDGINQFAKMIGSYCNAGDQWCASGSDGEAHNKAVEWNYVEAAKFINSKL